MVKAIRNFYPDVLCLDVAQHAAIWEGIKILHVPVGEQESSLGP